MHDGTFYYLLNLFDYYAMPKGAMAGHDFVWFFYAKILFRI